jgi:hypothetical protein
MSAYLLFACITKTFNILILIVVISMLINGLLILVDKQSQGINSNYYQ